MKLAEALIERSDLQKKTAELRTRVADSLYQVDGEEVENPRELLDRALALADRLEVLIRRINSTNSATAFDAEGCTGSLTDALARRDCLSSKHKTLLEALSNVSGRRVRYYDDRPMGKLVISPADLRKEADDLASQIRRLDLAIQQINWNTELL